jgi:DNA-binding NarL/FixJ family response regulator
MVSPKEHRVCDTCGKHVEELHIHHVLPRSLGGTDIATNLVNICLICHSAIHGIKLSSSSLIKLGLEKARAAGARFGAPSVLTQEKRRHILELSASGLSLRKISAAVGVSVGTVSGVVSNPEHKYGLTKKQRFDECLIRALPAE